jgi:hypothetical protein
MDRPAHFGNVPARTHNSNRINVRSMQFKPGDPGRDGSARRAGPATEINNHAGSHGQPGPSFHLRMN